MSPTRVPRLGSVAWAELEDANGFGKVRPAVVFTPTAKIAPGKPVRVVASWQAEILVGCVQQVVGIQSATIIGELLAKVSPSLPAPSASPAAGLGDPAAEILDDPRATSPSTAEDDQGERAGEIA